MWALAKDIILTAEYILGVVNVAVDAEFRSIQDRTDWKLHHELSIRCEDHCRWICLHLSCTPNYLAILAGNQTHWRRQQMHSASNGRHSRAMQPSTVFDRQSPVSDAATMGSGGPSAPQKIMPPGAKLTVKVTKGQFCSGTFITAYMLLFY